MAAAEITTLLNRWRAGDTSLPELEMALKAHYQTTATLHDVRLDLDRLQRCGFPEVVYGAGKTLEQLREILDVQQAAGQASLITRCDPGMAEMLAAEFPGTDHNRLARTVRRGSVLATGQPRVVIVTAGATDRPVAEEAAETVRWMGCDVDFLSDVGVAGPWRLIEQRERLRAGDVMIVVAGMEGALPSVAAGWVRCPVIAVPTSVGYGTNLQGLAPLLSMLNSCAANVAVVNIDAGFKGGYVAGMIARQTAAGRQQESQP